MLSSASPLPVTVTHQEEGFGSFMPTPYVIAQPDAAYYLKQGYDQVANVLAVTLGPTRGAVLNYSTTKERPELLNDAATIARRIVAIPDRRQDVGAMLMRQLVWRMHKEVGDGGATTAVLAKAILHEGTKMITAGANAVLVQNGIKKATKTAVSALRSLAQPITSQEQLAAVAQAVTAHADLAWVLGEMFSLLGPQAHISVESYVAPYLERAYLEGGRWSGQLISPYLITAPTTQRAIQTDCWVALYDGHLQDPDEVRPLLELVAQQKKQNLLLVAHEISGEPIVGLISGVHQFKENDVQIVAVGLKMGGERGQLELDDLGLLTGATLLGETMGRPLSSIKLADLGQTRRVEADKENLFVIQGRGNQRAIREQIENLQTRLDNLDPDETDERAVLQKRLARFSGSAGILKVGALTKAERTVLKQNAEQGIKALAATMSEGVLPGGGIAYVRAAEAIDPETAVHPEEQMGMIAVKRALEAPFYRLLTNAAIPAPAVVLHDVLAASPDAVFDIVSNTIQPAHEVGIMDAAKILRRALETASSSAEMALSVDVTVLRRRPVTNVDYEP
ncbi:MAG: TCP-1/cpn60 chaperonin family protein [Chloroflexota bacterium]